MRITLTPFEPGRAGGEAENQPMLDGYAFYASFDSLAGGMKVPYHGVSVFQTRRKAAHGAGWGWAGEDVHQL